MDLAVVISDFLRYFAKLEQIGRVQILYMLSR